MAWLDRPEDSKARDRIHKTIQQPCPRCGAAEKVMCVNPETGEESHSTCFERRVQVFGDSVRPTVGTGRTINYALAVWPTDIVSRATLRAFLPKGTRRTPGPQGRLNAFRSGQTEGGCKTNRISDAFQTHLKQLERDGLIYRGTEFVRIVDRRQLLDRAIYLVDNPLHSQFLELDRAASVVRQQIAEEQRPNVKRIRADELKIIQGLMQPGHLSGRDGTRRSVRHESGGIDIPLGETARRWNPTKNRNKNGR